jgi:enamine deaminase RidA (YjgF/YER057c/UK114 family)
MQAMVVARAAFGRKNPPARTPIEAKNSHPNMPIEIEATAAVPLDADGRAA